MSDSPTPSFRTAKETQGGDQSRAPSPLFLVPQQQQPVTSATSSPKPDVGPKTGRKGDRIKTTQPARIAGVGGDTTLGEASRPQEQLLQALQAAWGDGPELSERHMKPPFETLLEHLKTDKTIKDVGDFGWFTLRRQTGYMSTIILVRMMELFFNIWMEDIKACSQCNSDRHHGDPPESRKKLEESILLLEKYVEALSKFDHKTGREVEHFGAIFDDEGKEKKSLKEKINKRRLISNFTRPHGFQSLVEAMQRQDEHNQPTGCCDLHNRFCLEIAKLLNAGFSWRDELTTLDTESLKRKEKEEHTRNCEAYTKVYSTAVQVLKDGYNVQGPVGEPKEQKKSRNPFIRFLSGSDKKEGESVKGKGKEKEGEGQEGGKKGRK